MRFPFGECFHVFGAGLPTPPLPATEGLLFDEPSTSMESSKRRPSVKKSGGVGRPAPNRAVRSLAWGACLIVATVTSALANDSDHLLYLADQGLAVIQLRVELDGTPQRELCREQLAALCRKADTDHDGFLTDAEYQAGIVTHPAIQEAIARLGPKPDVLIIGQDKLPLAEVQRFLFHRIWTPLRVEVAGPLMSRMQAGVLRDRPVTDTQLFERLDADGNHKLTGRELDRAATVLGKLDFDEDEMISLNELRAQATPNAMPARNPNAGARRKDHDLSLLAPTRINFAEVRRILTRYDGEAKGTVKDQRLDRTEIHMTPAVFDQADADGDGFWDLDELWRFLERPTASVDIRWRTSRDGQPTLEIMIADDQSVRMIHQSPKSIQFDIHGTRFQLTVPANSQRTGIEAVAKAEFEALDRDKNEYLELMELLPNVSEDDPRRAMFKQMDADGDEKIYFQEFLANAQQRGSLRDSQVTLGVENLGRTLFGPLDLNGDGRLSPRELAQLKSRLPEWDTDGDGRLIEDEIPPQYRLTLSLGGDGSMSMTDDAGPVQSADAPLWFRKMDRNRDGDVTAKEFLGTKTQFEKIDANADGTIDAAEAARVK